MPHSAPSHTTWISPGYVNSLGAKTVLFVPVGFAGGTTASPWSSDAARDGIFAEMQSYFSTCSYGAFSLSSLTVSLQQTSTHPASFFQADTNLSLERYKILTEETFTALIAAGYIPSNYDFIFYVCNESAFPFGGAAGVGDSPGEIIIDGRNSQLTGTYNHELGHTLGLDHANAWNPKGLVPESLDGVHVEYGNIHDTMGSGSITANWARHHFTASFKNQLRWIPNEYVKTIGKGITMDLYAMDQTLVAGRKYAAKIFHSEKVHCWIEFRSAYSSLGAIISKAAPIGSRVLGPKLYGGAESLLLDMTPQTETFNDSGLKVGKTFRLLDGSFEIKVNSQSGSGADALINITFSMLSNPAQDSSYAARRREINGHIRNFYEDSYNTNALPNSKSITPQNFTELGGLRRTGWRPDTYDSRDYEFVSAATPDESVDLSDSPFMPPIFDQGQLGSCVANAAATAMMFLLKKKNPSYDIELSRLFIYYQARIRTGNIRQDSGTSIRAGIQSMDLPGASAEAFWTYADEGRKWSQKPPREAYKNAKLQNLLGENVGYYRIADQFDAVRSRTEEDLFSDIKKALSDGRPVVFGIMCSDLQFTAMALDPDGIIPQRDSEEIAGGHALLIVGYSEDRFKCRNSWGDDAGEDGSCYIHKNDVWADGADFWVLMDDEAPAPSPDPPHPGNMTHQHGGQLPHMAGPHPYTFSVETNGWQVSPNSPMK